MLNTAITFNITLHFKAVTVSIPSPQVAVHVQASWAMHLTLFQKWEAFTSLD